MVKKIDIKDLFDYTKTDKKSYTKILNATVIKKKQGRTPIGKIVMVKPKYFLLNSYADKDILKEALRHPNFNPESFTQRFNLPFVDLLAKKGFGRGRALLCIYWKIDKIPVFVVARDIKAIDKWAKGAKDAKEDKKQNSGNAKQGRRDTVCKPEAKGFAKTNTKRSPKKKD